MFSMKERWVKIANTETDLHAMLMGKSCAAHKINNTAVLLVHHNAEFHLVKNRCPHQGITLERASCEDGMIVCPWHHYAFDLKTGRGGGLYLDIYPIEQRADGFYAMFEYFSLF